MIRMMFTNVKWSYYGVYERLMCWRHKPVDLPDLQASLLHMDKIQQDSSTVLENSHKASKIKFVNSILQKTFLNSPSENVKPSEEIHQLSRDDSSHGAYMIQTVEGNTNQTRLSIFMMKIGFSNSAMLSQPSENFQKGFFNSPRETAISMEPFKFTSS
ncbi:hypothetical protein ROHU_031428 [Labeo rohita]|uniref:Uncharacterized protein n=1 Tax=Labeo rohita TaxID=84645 RepID=A0A498LMT0_LABRO|nr:hypothetical protein ROHU_031428 [Labeo rohita]